MTIQEIEAACNDSRSLDFTRHQLQTPVLTLEGTFYPLGFPVVVKTNEARVLELLDGLWGNFEQQHAVEPVRAEISVVEQGSEECPPSPVYRVMLPFMLSVIDGENYGIADIERDVVRISISRATLKYGLYAQYFLLCMPISCIATRRATPIHAGCVALDNRGVLLCGDSGAGKSTLSYACARKGWTYVADDASFLLNGGSKRLVAGDCHRLRFRPSAAEVFPELSGLEITPRAAGKPSIEVPTKTLGITCAQTAQADFIVFLNRRNSERQELLPYRKDVARYAMRQVLYGTPETLAAQYEAIQRLLISAQVFELRYTDLDWAIDRLGALVREGR
jgi:hypothetical protein